MPYKTLNSLRIELTITTHQLYEAIALRDNKEIIKLQDKVKRLKRKIKIKELMNAYWYEMRYPRLDKAKELKKEIEELRKEERR